MSAWSRMTILSFGILLAQASAGWAVGPVDPNDPSPPSCGADGICRINECRADPDCERASGPGRPPSTPATTYRLTGTPEPTDVSGIEGSRFTRGTAVSGDKAVFAILSRERSDNPCYVAVGVENINNPATDTVPTPAIDLCGGNGPTSSILHADYLDVNAGGGDDRVFVTGVQVCMDRGDDRVKGIHLHGKRITMGGSLVDFQPDEQASRTNCHQDHWHSWADCPSGQLATAVDLHFDGGSLPRSLTGIGLQCRAFSASSAAAARSLPASSSGTRAAEQTPRPADKEG